MDPGGAVARANCAGGAMGGAMSRIWIAAVFGFAPFVSWAAICGRPCWQQSRMHPDPVICIGIWQSMPIWLMVDMLQSGAQGMLEDAPVEQLRPAKAGCAA